MPWTPNKASRFTKRANTSDLQRKWAKVANSIIRKTGDDKKAIKIANAAIKKLK